MYTQLPAVGPSFLIHGVVVIASLIAAGVMKVVSVLTRKFRADGV